MTVREHPKSSLTAWERWELASFDPNRRVADGVIRLVQRREADSFLQNAAR